MAFRQSSSKDTISLGVKEVRSGRLESSWRHWRATWTARLVGILVKRDTTSNETSTSSSSTVCEVMKLAKSVELRTWCSELPTRGDKMLTRCLERFTELVSYWFVLCKARSNLCRGCGKSPLICLLWELGPLGVHTRSWHDVLVRRKVLLIPRGDKIRLIASEVFLTYGIVVEVVVVVGF